MRTAKAASARARRVRAPLLLLCPHVRVTRYRAPRKPQMQRACRVRDRATRRDATRRGATPTIRSIVNWPPPLRASARLLFLHDRDRSWKPRGDRTRSGFPEDVSSFSALLERPRNSLKFAPVDSSCTFARLKSFKRRTLISSRHIETAKSRIIFVVGRVLPYISLR